VLEDAPAGVAAGLAAGMHVIALLTSHLGNPSDTVAIMQDKVIDAGGDPDEVLAWVREHGGYADKSFGVRARQGFDMRPKAPSKHYYVVPEDALK
jgi:hypothetical protein